MADITLTETIIIESTERGYMREFCQNIQTLVSNGTDDAELRKQKDAMLKTIYNILCVTLGTPPTSIVWEYQKNSDKQFVRIGPMSPVDFYKTHVKPQYDVSNKICIVNDPRPHNPYGQLYTVNYLNNMSRGQPVLYVNQPVEVLKNLAMTAIQRDEAVWFGCDVGKHFYGKAGILDVNMLDHELVFGTDLNGLEKSDRLIYGDSLMTHAMLFTGVNIENGKSTKWRVENSWGDEDADKGYLLMTDEWFSEFVYEVVIDKKYISSEILEILQQDPTVLPAWDPMGSLA